MVKEETKISRVTHNMRSSSIVNKDSVVIERVMIIEDIVVDLMDSFVAEEVAAAIKKSKNATNHMESEPYYRDNYDNY